MTGKLYFILGSTLLMGMFAGAYLYLTVYAPTYESDVANPDSISPDATVIEGQMYGDCDKNNTCGSFRLIDDRSYRYIAYTGAKIEQGKLASDVSDKVFNAVGTIIFFDDAKPITQGSCSSQSGGIDFTYTVTHKQDVYTFDTCTTALAYDQKFQTDLLAIWKFVDDPTTTYPSFLDEGIGGLFKHRFQGN